jgi:RIO-like serine/threonine protein kinase
MRALGRRNLPETLALNGVTWSLVRTHKHDFWAVTGFYENAAGERAVLKMGRTEPFCGFPMEFIGRWLCRRELRFYQRLSDLPSVPPVLGRVGETGFVHAFAPGLPLSRTRPVPDGYFDALLNLMHELHSRGIAYVDANKPENILIGDDFQPHLIDFQISWDLHAAGNHSLARWLHRRFKRADVYHVLKHKKRMRPDELSEEERSIVQNRSTLIRVHRVITWPYFRLRRTTFKRLRASGRLLPEGSK